MIVIISNRTQSLGSAHAGPLPRRRLLTGVLMIKNNKIQYVSVAAAVIAVLTLPVACGVKPDMVDPPSSVKVDTFPQTYPPADSKTHPPGRYLPDTYHPPATPDTRNDKGQIKP